MRIRLDFRQFIQPPSQHFSPFSVEGGLSTGLLVLVDAASDCINRKKWKDRVY